MADPNNITLRSDKSSFLLFEEMDANLLELKDLILEFNTFVSVNFANHVSDFNQLVLDFTDYQTEVANEFLTTVKLDSFNTFTNTNVFNSDVQLNGNSSATNLNISGGSINDTPIGASVASSAKFTTLESSTISASGGSLNNVRIGEFVQSDAAFSNLSSLGSVLFDGADLLKLPIWTTLTRPSPGASTIGFNSDTGEFEGHNGIEWSSVGGSTIVSDSTTNSNLYPVFVDSSSGTAKEINVDENSFNYNPSLKQLTIGTPYASNGIFMHSAIITQSVTIGPGTRGISTYITIADGVDVTVDDDGIWTIV